MTRRQIHLLGHLAAAWLVSNVPIIRAPFEWYESYFHELGHATFTLLTGGRVERLELHLLGSGAVLSSGGWPFLISLAGYASTFLFGGLLYLAAASNADKVSPRWAAALGLLIAATVIRWASWIDLPTLGIGAVMSVILIALWRWNSKALTHTVLKFIGAYVFVAGLYSPTFLLFGFGGHSDARNLSAVTGVPQIVWIALWLAMGAYGLRLLWKVEGRGRYPAAP
ncbi:M50 family metallopeptidase [Azospirillum canadense]|uniref:M50 family metallopeptidase n=1 Tax=Azospirillum canadense TaxID=403962 RepID=UPI0022266A26|nr:M50 family metallopeptidase [Azospirillum canadense]MCW2239085.1 hypothetical protein [Azospirillum canadense]